MKLLRVPRSGFDYKNHREISRVASSEPAEGEIVNIYETMPFYGVPQAGATFAEVRAVYLCPHPEHEKFPYLLRKLEIERPNQVWSTDITYPAPDIGRW